MYFKDERHKTSFTNAVKGLNQKDRKLMSKIYSFCTEWSYTLLCCAKDLAYGTEHITAADLADREVVSPKLLKIICNGIAIRRYGVEEINGQ